MILNGLGATKYEELFVVWRTVARLLRDAGYTIVDPEVGELVTSLDMAGCSLTLVCLDDELETLWRAPADTPAYRKGIADRHGWRTRAPDRGRGHRRRRTVTAEVDAGVAALWAHGDGGPDGDRGRDAADAEQSSAASTRSPATVTTAAGMVKGTSAAVRARQQRPTAGAGAATVLRAPARPGRTRPAARRACCGAPRWLRVGERARRRQRRDTGGTVAAAVRAGLDAITALGKAKVGDKTMVDALLPFVDTLEQQTDAGADLSAAWAAAADAADRPRRQRPG